LTNDRKEKENISRHDKSLTIINQKTGLLILIYFRDRKCHVFRTFVYLIYSFARTKNCTRKKNTTEKDTVLCRKRKAKGGEGKHI